MAATEEKEIEKTISEDLVVTKYKLAGEITNSKYMWMCANFKPKITSLWPQMNSSN